MKKYLSIVCALVIIVSFAACSKEKAEDTVAKPEDSVSVELDNETQEQDTENVTEEEKPSEETEENKPVEDKQPTEDKQPAEDKKPAENKKPAVENKPAEDKKPAEENKPAEEDKPLEDKPSVEEKPAETKKTLGNQILAEFKASAGSGSALSIAEKLSSLEILSVLPMGAMSVEPGYLAGFDNAEITGFSEGATFAPMMGTIPFVGYVFTLEEGVNASDFISKLKSSANLRWNICTEAEEMIAGSAGNKVFFVMCNKSLDE